MPLIIGPISCSRASLNFNALCLQNSEVVKLFFRGQANNIIATMSC